jgi:GntR family transcriptional regulator
MEVAYHKVYNILREQILEKKLSDGEKIPPERVLCDTYGVSRITIRQALKMLQDQGLLERLPGKGTFVRRATKRKVPILDMDYEKSLKKEAPDIIRKVITWEPILPSEEVMNELSLLKSEQCLLIERIDIQNDEPLSYDKGFIPLNYSSSVDELIINQVSFLHLWAKRENLSISYIRSSTEAVEAGEIDVERLRVPLRAPMLMTTDTIFSTEGKALAVFVTIYRGDKFRLVSTTHVEV